VGDSPSPPTPPEPERHSVYLSKTPIYYGPPDGLRIFGRLWRIPKNTSVKTARSVRRLLQKLEKVVDKDNLERARLKERIRYLEEEMRALKPVT